MPIRSITPLFACLLSLLPAALTVFLITPSSLAWAAPTQSQIKDKAVDLARIKSKIGNVAQALATDRGRQGHLQAQVESAERKLRDSRSQLADVTTQLQAQDARLAQAKAAHAAAPPPARSAD